MCRNVLVEVLHASILRMTTFVVLMTATSLFSTGTDVKKGLTAAILHPFSLFHMLALGKKRKEG